MLDFPTSPTDGQTYVFGNYLWRFDVNKGWTQIPNGGAGTVAWYEVASYVENDVIELPDAEPAPWYEMTYV